MGAGRRLFRLPAADRYQHVRLGLNPATDPGPLTDTDATATGRLSSEARVLEGPGDPGRAPKMLCLDHGIPPNTTQKTTHSNFTGLNKCEI